MSVESAHCRRPGCGHYKAIHYKDSTDVSAEGHCHARDCGCKEFSPVPPLALRAEPKMTVTAVETPGEDKYLTIAEMTQDQVWDIAQEALTVAQSGDASLVQLWGSIAAVERTPVTHVVVWRVAKEGERFIFNDEIHVCTPQTVEAVRPVIVEQP